jgi:hypothetical protein
MKARAGGIAPAKESVRILQVGKRSVVIGPIRVIRVPFFRSPDKQLFVEIYVILSNSFF